MLVSKSKYCQLPKTKSRLPLAANSVMHKFLRNLITVWRKLEIHLVGEKIVIAVSGGADSVSLALAVSRLCEMKKLKNEFVIAHFNHELRGKESDEDENFTRKLAEDLKFEFIGGKPANKLFGQKGNLEQIARRARYDFLYETACRKNARFVLTAHTLNDQAETFLLNLLRGSGIEGLRAMKTRRILESENETKSRIQNSESKIELVRPLLNWAKRTDTENFCLENGVNFRQDSMNEDRKFSRVRIRREIIPLLESFNPKIIERLAATSEILALQTDFANPQQTELAEKLSIKELQRQDKPLRLKCLREWLRVRRGNLRKLGSKHFEAIDDLILSRKSGRIIELPDNGKVVKKNGKLSFEINQVEKR